MAVTTQQGVVETPHDERRYGTFMAPRLYPLVKGLDTYKLEIDPEALSHAFTGASGRQYYMDNGIYREDTEYIPGYSADYHYNPIVLNYGEGQAYGVQDPRQREGLLWMYDIRRSRGNINGGGPTNPTPTNPTPTQPYNPPYVTVSDGQMNGGNRWDVNPETWELIKRDGRQAIRNIYGEPLPGVLGPGEQQGTGRVARRKVGGLISYIDYIQ